MARTIRLWAALAALHQMLLFGFYLQKPALASALLWLLVAVTAHTFVNIRNRTHQKESRHG
jgi:hypothetical protein